MPRSKTGRADAAKSEKAHSARTLPLSKEKAQKVAGGKRTTIRDAHDKYANQE